MALHRILVVHDSPAMRETLAILLGGDYDVRVCELAEYATCDPSEFPPHLLIADPRARAYPIPTGAAVLWLEAPEATPSAAPFGQPFSARGLRQRVAAALTTPRLPQPDARVRLEPPFVPSEAAHLLAEATRSSLPVHLFGEPGIGKRVVARALHAACRMGLLLATDATDAERTLGALSPEVGAVFLDRVESLSVAGQQMLLSGLGAAGTLTRPDGSAVRVITATATDLAEAADAGRFSPELYYRLTLLTVHLPPLRARPSDIPSLAQHLAAELAAALGRTPVTLSERALGRLANYLWFGNLAELEAVLGRSIARAHGSAIDADDLLFDGRVRGPAVTERRPADPPPGLGAQPLDLIVNELAHEFKNPLVTLKTFAHHLCHTPAAGDGEVEQVARLTGEAVARIDQTLENLLEFTRLETPAATALYLSTLLDPVLEQCHQALAARGVHVEHDVLPAVPVCGDPQQLAYALANLLRALARDLPAGAALRVGFAPPSTIVIRLPEGTQALGNHLATVLGRSADAAPAPPLGVAIANAVLARNGAQLTVAPEDPSTVRVCLQPADAAPSLGADYGTTSRLSG